MGGFFHGRVIPHNHGVGNSIIFAGCSYQEAGQHSTASTGVICISSQPRLAKGQRSWPERLHDGHDRSQHKPFAFLSANEGLVGSYLARNHHGLPTELSHGLSFWVADWGSCDSQTTRNGVQSVQIQLSSWPVR